MAVRPYGIGILKEIVKVERRPPGPADDFNFGYEIGQFWIDELAGACYQCIQIRPLGSAQWIQISGGGGGGAGFVWRGPWSSATNYVTNDVVGYNNSSYIALQSNLNVTPDSGPPNWDLIAAGGIDQAYADAHYRTKGSLVINQSIPSTVWTLTHNLGTYPNVTILDSSGQVIETDISYPDMNTVVSTSAFSFSGKAILT